VKKEVKKPILLFFIGILMVQISVSAQEDQKALYQKKISTCKKNRDLGIGLTIGGIMMTAIGARIITTAYPPYYSTSFSQKINDSEALLGVILFDVGIVTTIGGLVIWSIGSNNKNYYIRKLDALTLNLNPGTHQKISLVYRF